MISDVSPAQARALELDYAALVALNPALIYGLLTPFGQHGPWAERAASGLVVQAASGLSTLPGGCWTGASTDRGRCRQYAGGNFLLQGLLAALSIASVVGRGSVWRCLSSVPSMRSRPFKSPRNINQIHGRATTVGDRTRRRILAGRRATSPLCSPLANSLVVVRGKQSQWPAFCRALELEHLLQDARFDQEGKNPTGLGADAATLRPLYEAAFRAHTPAELVELIRGFHGAAIRIIRMRRYFLTSRPGITAATMPSWPRRRSAHHQDPLELFGIASGSTVWSAHPW